MRNTFLKTLLFAACFTAPSLIFPQIPNTRGGFATIDKIYVEGNKRTMTDIVLRELDFCIGDTIPLENLAQSIERNERNLLNTGLFTSARISFKEWEGATNKIGLRIELKEDWYFFPFPIVELADRNFNVWWTDYDHSLSRLNLGIRAYHNNLTGRRDRLKTVVQFGFTKKYEVIYTLPAFNKKKTWGININVLLTREKEIAYATFDNRLLFHRNENDVLLHRLRLGGGLFYRKKIFSTHRLNASLQSHRIHESIAKDFNPDYFLGRDKQRYLSVKYEFSQDKRDIRPYPMSGYLLQTSLSKHGFFGLDDRRSTEVVLVFQQYFGFGKKWSGALAAKGKVELQRQQQPYYTSRALGYEDDFVRGYEFYVMDGLDFGFLKKSLRFNFFSRQYDWGRYMKLDSFKKMPVKLFLVAHHELGYANNPFYKTNNPLDNQLLWGTGIGLDVVMYYNKVLNFEYSRNHKGEHGFFLHWSFQY